MLWKQKEKFLYRQKRMKRKKYRKSEKKKSSKKRNSYKTDIFKSCRRNVLIAEKQDTEVWIAFSRKNVRIVWEHMIKKIVDKLINVALYVVKMITKNSIANKNQIKNVIGAEE